MASKLAEISLEKPRRRLLSPMLRVNLMVKRSEFSTAKLKALLLLHMRPIKQVVYLHPNMITIGEILSWGGFRAYMLSALIPTGLRYPAVPLERQLDHNWSVHPGPLVLRTGPLKSPTPTPDRDRTVSRRSEPSSRTALIGEQPNPWELLHPQDAMSRHRGAKPKRRYELLASISLLSPAYLLSVERWPFHTEPPDH